MSTAQQAQFKQALRVCALAGGTFVVQQRTYNHDANAATPEIEIPATYDNDSNPATPEVPVPSTPSFWNRLKFW